MQRIEVKPGDVFLLETDKWLEAGQGHAILNEWHTLFPNNKLFITKKDSLSIMTPTNDENKLR